MTPFVDDHYRIWHRHHNISSTLQFITFFNLQAHMTSFMDYQGQYVYLCGWGGLSLSWAEIGKGLFQLLLLWSGKFASPTFAAWQLFVELKWTVKRIVLVLDNVVVIVVVAVEAVGRQRRQKIETSRPDDALWIIAVERQVEYVLETVFRYLQKNW